jgi:hypothetical protein
MDSVRGKGGFATFAFIVLAVLYVFTNEVQLQVAKTLVKRLKRLSGKVEMDQEEITEKDMELLRGWRWRVILWGN